MRKGILLLLAWTLPCVAQDYAQSIKEHQRKLSKVREEIAQYESQMRSQTKKERGELERLNDTGRRIALLQKLTGELEIGRKMSEQNIALLQRQLIKTEGEIVTLQRLIERRLLQMYKHRDEDPLALVLTSQSFGQAYARVKYLRLIRDQDRKDLALLRQKKKDIETRKVGVQKEFEYLKKVIAEKQSEKVKLDGEVVKRQASLQAITKDKKLLASMIDQKREDLETMRSLIVELEKKRKEAEKRAKEAKAAGTTVLEKRPTFVEKSSFHLYKGQLPYPASGRLFKKFGDHIHPVHGTKTRNPGIELQTQPSASVYAVAKGQVTVVTWLRRFGNTIMIDHGGGYYTVYAYLSEMLVNDDQLVSPGDVIGRVDEGEGGRYLLYFAIFKDHDPQDPMKWLKK